MGLSIFYKKNGRGQERNYRVAVKNILNMGGMHLPHIKGNTVIF